MTEDKFIKYLEIRFDKTGTINDIKRDEVVEFEGETLQIGEFFATIRRQHRLYVKGEKSKGCRSPKTLSRYEALDKMDFIWEPGTIKSQELQENDPCLDYITAYYDKNKTFEGLPEKIEIDGTTYGIKAFISHIRAKHKSYVAGEKEKGNNTPTALRRYKALDERGFEWEPQLLKQQRYEEDDKHIRYLKEYYQTHQTLDGVPKTVVFEGEELNIDNFLSDRRKKHRKSETTTQYKPSKLERKRWTELDAMNYDWNAFERRKQELLENDPYIRYLKEHHKKHGTINNISPKQEVEFEGEILKIGAFVNDYRKKHYAYTVKKSQTPSIKSPLALKRYAELEALGIDWRPSETSFSAAKHARENGVRAKTLKKYIKKFNGNIQKATKMCQAARKYDSQVQQRNPQNKTTLRTIMQEFDVDIHTLVATLSRKSLQTKTTPTKPLMYDETTNLRDFCISQGLNYRVIQKAIRLKSKGLCDEDLQSLINRTICDFKVHGQSKPSTWIYSKYGNEALVRHLLLSMHLDPVAILTDMSKNCITLEEAIENNSFERHSKEETQHLKPLYHDLIKFFNIVNYSREYTPETAPDAIVGYFQTMIKEYELTEEEFNVIKDSFFHYSNAIEMYKLYNVGFEKDPEKRVEKILYYQLDDEEIEDAFFMPLNFDQKVLIGRNSELYQRRMLLKNITTSWNQLSDDDKKSVSINYALTDEELEYITKTRTEIDTTKAKVKEKK